MHEPVLACYMYTPFLVSVLSTAGQLDNKSQLGFSRWEETAFRGHSIIL